MDYLTVYLSLYSCFITVALIYYVVDGHRIFRNKPQKLDKNAQQLLSEILSGPTVIKIEVVEKDSLIQWRR